MALQKLIFAGLLTAIVFVKLSAQAPIIPCPADTVQFASESTNNLNYWNQNYWWDSKTNNHNMTEEPVLLECTSINNCPSGGLSFRYILTLYLDQDISKKTIIDSDSLPGMNIVYFNNKENHLFSGEGREFDERPVLPVQKFRFDIKLDTPGMDIWKARVNWTNQYTQNFLPHIPYGTHHIQWIVTDGCGNTSACGYFFTIKDTKKPEVECLNGLSVNLMPNGFFPGTLQLWASDFLIQTKDNYTPSSKLLIGIRKSGTGTGFPYKQDGSPQTSLLFSCSDMGTQNIELWSMDLYGNTNFCETYVLIQDNLSSCASGWQVSGKVITETFQGVSNVIINMNFSSNGTPVVLVNPVFTDINGEYDSQVSGLAVYGNINIEPTLPLDPLNGVNTWDLLLISRHILGLEPLNSPYKLISADANKSGTITTFDVVELRKLILGTYSVLPSNSSWRFIDRNQVFLNPQNPFAEYLREHFSIAANFSTWTDPDFIGCKIGDVDLTATPNNLTEPEERNDGLSTLSVHNRSFKKGETITVHFQAPTEIAGLQFTLNAKGLRPVRVIPGQGLTEDHFSLFSGGTETESAPALTAAFETGAVDFEVQFVALSDGLLSEMLQISNEITPAMAFEKDGKRNDLALRFEEEMAADQPVLFQNISNPWTTSTRIPFYLPEEGFAEITVYNQQGMVVFSNSDYYAKGNHQVLLNNNPHYSSGVYLYQLKTAGLTATQKTTFIQN